MMRGANYILGHQGLGWVIFGDNAFIRDRALTFYSSLKICNVVSLYESLNEENLRNRAYR